MFRYKCTVTSSGSTTHQVQVGDNKLNTLTQKCTERKVLNYSGTDWTVHVFADSFTANHSQALVNAVMNFRAP